MAKIIRVKKTRDPEMPKEPEAVKRVAAYCRVSTNKLEQEESLDNQMETFRFRIATRKDWKLVGVYADEGISGTSVKGRVQFEQMIEDCEAGKIDYVLTKSISRFARNTLDCISYIRKLQSLGVNVFFEKEGIDTAEAQSEMVLSIMASFAQEESRSLSENVKWGIRKRFNQGRGIKVPLYGFRHSDDTRYEIVEDQAAIVREIFDRYVHGENPTAIANDLNARGVELTSGDKWNRLKIERMLKNEKYVGDEILQKTYTKDHLSHKQLRNKGELDKIYLEGVHPAIVDRSVYEQAQKIVGMKKQTEGATCYPYGDMLKCPRCGKTLIHGTMNAFKFKGKSIKYGGWGCYNRGGCGEYLLLQMFLDEAIIEAYAEKFDKRWDTVEFGWLDDAVEKLELGKEQVTIYWRDGEKSVVEMDFRNDRYSPLAFARTYNDYLMGFRKGEKKLLGRNVMGIRREVTFRAE